MDAINKDWFLHSFLVRIGQASIPKAKSIYFLGASKIQFEIVLPLEIELTGWKINFPVFSLGKKGHDQVNLTEVIKRVCFSDLWEKPHLRWACSWLHEHRDNAVWFLEHCDQTQVMLCNPERSSLLCKLLSLPIFTNCSVESVQQFPLDGTPSVKPSLSEPGSRIQGKFLQQVPELTQCQTMKWEATVSREDQSARVLTQLCARISFPA